VLLLGSHASASLSCLHELLRELFARTHSRSEASFSRFTISAYSLSRYSEVE
jgi:hypothetical protein